MRIDTKNKLLRRIKIHIYRIVVSFIDNFTKKDQTNTLNVFWLKRTQNFGDSLNPLLLKKLTGKNIQWVKSYSPNIHYITMGSILDSATKDTIVWGAGFISQESHCFEKPKKVCAVRGPKSREKLLADGIECPKIYGDPALLLPKIYQPSIKKTHKLGIIPHFVDKQHPWFETIKNHKNIKIIDIQNPDLFAVVDDILSCENIASSSLHGMIVSDAYQIPSLWIEFSNNVIGEGFKFIDYFLSVNRIDNKPFLIKDTTTTKNIFDQFYEYEIKIDLQSLLENAPFPILDQYKKV